MKKFGFLIFLGVLAIGLVAATLYVRHWLLTTELSSDAAPAQRD